MTTLLTSASKNYGFGPPLMRARRIEETPLSYILDEIRACIDAKLYYAALSMLLALPDICSALNTEPGHSRFGSVRRRYEEWCRKFAEPLFESVTAEDIWALRGGVVHNAMLSGHPSNKRGRLLLMLPEKNNVVISEAVIVQCGKPPQDGLQIHFSYFCDNLITAASNWYHQCKEDPLVQKNLPEIVRLRPQGLAPFMVGPAVIA